jgi:hypothetical protein
MWGWNMAHIHMHTSPLYTTPKKHRLLQTPKHAVGAAATPLPRHPPKTTLWGQESWALCAWDDAQSPALGAAVQSAAPPCALLCSCCSHQSQSTCDPTSCGVVAVSIDGGGQQRRGTHPAFANLLQQMGILLRSNTILVHQRALLLSLNLFAQQNTCTHTHTHTDTHTHVSKSA